MGKNLVRVRGKVRCGDCGKTYSAALSNCPGCGSVERHDEWTLAAFRSMPLPWKLWYAFVWVTGSVLVVYLLFLLTRALLRSIDYLLGG